MQRELAFELVSEIPGARVDGSDMESFDGVALGSFVAQVRSIRFSDFGVSGTCPGENVAVGRRPDNVHDVWHSRLSTSKHSNTHCLGHTDVVFIGQCARCVAQPAVNFKTFQYTLFAPH